jgi:hypothetical protein
LPCLLEFRDVVVLRQVHVHPAVPPFLPDEVTHRDLLENMVNVNTYTLTMFSDGIKRKIKMVNIYFGDFRLTLLYEIIDIERFPTAKAFCSFSRVVFPAATSDGKLCGYRGFKQGNPYLK